MKKGVSPLIATVMLIAFTLSIASLLGGWYTSTVKTETKEISKLSSEIINYTKGLLDIVSVTCDSTNSKLNVVVNNLGTIELYNFSVFAKINNTLYLNTTGGGPSSTNALFPGEQEILSYYCSECVQNSIVSLVRVSASSAPGVYVERKVSETCN